MIIKKINLLTIKIHFFFYKTNNIIKIILTFLAFTCLVNSFAQLKQKNNKDSINRLIKKTTLKDDLLKLNIELVKLHSLAAEKEDARIHLLKAKSLSEVLNTKKSFYNYFYAKSFYLGRFNQIDSSIFYSKKILKDIDLSSKSEVIIPTYFLIGNSFLQNRDYENALKYTLDLKKRKGLKYGDSTEIYNRLAFIYNELKDYNKAVEYINTSLGLVRKKSDPEELVYAYSTLGTILYSKNEYQKSIENFNFAINILDDKLQKLPHYQLIQSTIKSNLGIAYYNTKEYNNAIKTLNESINKNPNENVVTESYLYLSRVFFKENNLIEALDKVNIAIDLAVKNNIKSIQIESQLLKSDILLAKKDRFNAIIASKEALKLSKNNSLHNLEIESLEKLSELLRSTNINESYQLLKLVNSKKDSIYKNKEKSIRLKSDIEYKHLETQEKLIKSNLKLEILEQKKKADRNKRYALVALIIIITTSLLIVITRQKKLIKTRKIIHEKEKELIKVKEITIEQEINYKNKQITDFAIHISKKNELLAQIRDLIKKMTLSNLPKSKSQSKEIIYFINDSISKNKEKVALYAKSSNLTDTFEKRIIDLFPDLTKSERKILILLRLDYSSKQISSQLNVSEASINNRRLSIRKKIGVEKGDNLSEFIKNL